MTEEMTALRALRSTVERAIETGTPIRTHLTRKKLDRMKAGCDRGEWLEAYALIHVKAKARPRLVIRILGFLRDLRQRQGREDEFRAFTRRLNSMCAPQIIGPHGYARPFSKEDEAEIFEEIGLYAQVIEELGYEPFIISGTLLGAVRDGGLMPHDDDVDLAVRLPASNVAEAAACWQVLRQKLLRVGLLADQQASGPQPNLHKTLPQLKLGSLDCMVDLFPCWVENGAAVIYPHARLDYPADAVFPLAECEVTGLKRPRDPATVLEQNYGPGWKEQDPYFSFNWTAARSRFADLIDALPGFSVASHRLVTTKTVMTYGTFDLFHVGHLRILERARAMGDRLVVGLSTDEFNAAKGKRSEISYEDRRAILLGLDCVDEVVPEEAWDQKRLDMVLHGVHTFVMGDDWTGKFDHLKDLADVRYVPRTEDISTTMIKDRLAMRAA